MTIDGEIRVCEDIIDDGDGGFGPPPMPPGFGDGEFGGGGGGLGPDVLRIGTFMIPLDQFEQIVSDLQSNTAQWALADIHRFRVHGLHVTNPQTSLIPWQTLQINWNQFGADDPGLSDEQVWFNFADALLQGGFVPG